MALKEITTQDLDSVVGGALADWVACNNDAAKTHNETVSRPNQGWDWLLGPSSLDRSIGANIEFGKAATKCTKDLEAEQGRTPRSDF